MPKENNKPEEEESEETNPLLDSLFNAAPQEAEELGEEFATDTTGLSMADAVQRASQEKPSGEEEEEEDDASKRKREEEEDDASKRKREEEEDDASKRKREEEEDDASKRKREKKPSGEEEPLPEFEPKPGEERQPSEPAYDLDDPELSEEERERIELAAFAETTGDGKYKDLASRYYDYFKAHKDFVAQARDKDPDVEFDEDNEEYQKFLKENRPVLSEREVRKLDREMIKEEIRRENRKEIESQKKEIDRIKTEPEVNKAVSSFKERARKRVLSDELSKLIEDEGEKAAREEYGFEMEVYDQ